MAIKQRRNVLNLQLQLNWLAQLEVCWIHNRIWSIFWAYLHCQASTRECSYKVEMTHYFWNELVWIRLIGGNDWLGHTVTCSFLIIFYVIITKMKIRKSNKCEQIESFWGKLVSGTLNFVLLTIGQQFFNRRVSFICSQLFELLQFFMFLLFALWTQNINSTRPHLILQLSQTLVKNMILVPQLSLSSFLIRVFNGVLVGQKLLAGS